MGDFESGVWGEKRKIITSPRFPELVEGLPFLLLASKLDKATLRQAQGSSNVVKVQLDEGYFNKLPNSPRSSDLPNDPVNCRPTDVAADRAADCSIFSAIPGLASSFA